MRVGIFGGTFDPVHYGHLKIASFGIRALSLSEVLFVPARNPVSYTHLTLPTKA